MIDNRTGAIKERGQTVDLVKRARQEAKKNGAKVSSETAKGLEAVQTMHDVCKKANGSPSKIYTAQKQNGK